MGVILNVDDIMVPQTRVRKEFKPEKIEELIVSILASENLHLPVVDRDNFLLVGERRYRAIAEIARRGLSYKAGGKTLRPGLIMVHVVGVLDHIQKLQAEYDENVKRVDLTWQEKAMATEALERLRTAQAEARQQAGDREARAPTNLELGEELKESGIIKASHPQTIARDVSKDLMVAAWLTHEDEEVSKAKSRDEALKIIEQKVTRMHREALAAQHGLKVEKSSAHEPIFGDMKVVMPTFPQGHFDLIICDPPYGIDADTFNNQAAVPHDYRDRLADVVDIWETLAIEGYRVTKEKAHAYIFCDQRRFRTLSDIFERAGWDVWPTALIWDKGPNSGIAPRPEHGPRRTYECILYAIKGNKRVNKLAPDVLRVSNERGIERAAHKPVDLYAELIDRSAIPGDRILDPCAGSGPIFPAAIKRNVYATGIEIERAAFGLCLQRLEAAERSSSGGDGSFPSDREGDELEEPMGVEEEEEAADD